MPVSYIAVAGVPLAFLWIAFLVELSPGPNMTYLAALTLADGRRAGFAAVAGIATGLLAISLLAALGVAASASESPSLYAVLRWAGVVYMLWLAYDIWRTGDGLEAELPSDGVPLATYFARGFLTNVLNPKAAIFFIAVLPQFIDPTRRALPQTLALSVAYVIVATIIHTAIVLLAMNARPHLGNAASMGVVRRVLALGLVAVAVWLLVSTAENRPA